MKCKSLAVVFHVLFILLVSVTIVRAQTAPHQLWQIGKADEDMKEFALGSGRYREFKTDPFFVVGRSHESSDWTYCHPGPDDAWAGSRKHSFSIVFGVKAIPAAAANGRSKLTIGLVDVGRANVSLICSINGRDFPYTVGAGPANAIFGRADRGGHTGFSIEFPTALLTAGNNTITITNDKGSWLIYDWIGLETSTVMQTTAVTPSIGIAASRELPFIRAEAGREIQSTELMIANTGAGADVLLKIKGRAPQTLKTSTGMQTVMLNVPAVTRDSSFDITLESAGRKVFSQKLDIHPVPRMTIYILPHSHNDIGYTEIQTRVEDKQIQNLLTGIEYAKKTKGYPEGARFVWNLEGLYAADLYMNRMNGDQQKAFSQAVREGSVALNGMYLNTLTGLCRPEELLNLFAYSTRLSKLFNVRTDAAMISDVPGYTWGTVDAMAQAGIKYFSAAPNFFDRIGDILQQWEDKPFYWLSPSGKDKVLVWVSHRGYALSHEISHPDINFVTGYIQHLRDVKFPYDISYIRWSGHGDNAVPDLEISDFVKDWNSRYSWPRFVITSTSKAFHAFEDRYGSRLPQYKGDWTGYWEDGAGSSAYETSENRTSSSRLSQAGALWAMTKPEAYPAAAFQDAWRHVLLYSEHTWGADCSITDPLSQKTTEQWAIKKSYATTADSLSRQLLRSAAAGSSAAAGTAVAGGMPTVITAIDVFNTNSWQRTGLVLVPAALSAAGDRVTDPSGVLIPSQRLHDGSLAFLARELPAFGARRYGISSGKPAGTASPAALPNTLDNGILRLTIDPISGSINSLRQYGIGNNFSDSAGGTNLNEYLFLKGDQLADLQRNGPVKISVKDQGPVLTTLRIESAAPGCKWLTRDITLAAGLDYVEINNILDKLPAELNPHPGDYGWANTGGKESVHIAFPFHVDGGQMRLEIPMAMMQPEKDQIPGSCKNWLETGSWADVSNTGLGITWASLDAPLVEAGAISATLLGGQSNPAVWRKHIESTQKLYSWALNNHWETNYRAYQDGLISFRYALQPHAAFDPAAASRFATGLTQPLIVAPAAADRQLSAVPQLGSDKIIALVFKPGEDGRSDVLTLYNPTDKPQSGTLQWSRPVGAIHYSNTGEEELAPFAGDIQLAPMQVVTLKVARRPA